MTGGGPGISPSGRTHRHEDFFLQKAKNQRKGLCPRNTQMKNSCSVSALIGVICGQVRIRLRLCRVVIFCGCLTLFALLSQPCPCAARVIVALTEGGGSGSVARLRNFGSGGQYA